MKIGFTCSAFDLLHPGHLLMLKQCRENCDRLVVGIHVNPSAEREDKNAPVESVFERWMRLARNTDVDAIIPYETEEDLRALLLYVNPAVRFIGEDWKEHEITAPDLEIPIHWIERRHGYSSSKLRKKLEEI
jgi:glycerol-3-phosphate cytidylyltransferase